MKFVKLCSILFWSLITCSEVINNTTTKTLSTSTATASAVDETTEENNTNKSAQPVPTTSDNESTSFILWYMMPEEVRKEVVHFYYIHKSSKTEIFKRPRPREMVELSPNRYRTIEPEYFVNKVKKDRDWVEFSVEYLKSARAYAEISQLNFLVEVIKNASPTSIEIIFKRHLHALTLLQKIQTKSSDELVDIILAARSEANDIIEIFRILERYSDFDLANLNYLRKIRAVAFERDDYELLMFTNAYSGIIEPVNKCQRELLNHLKCDRIPKVWNLICVNPHKSAVCLTKECDEFIKFRLFSSAVNTNHWTLDMFAVACQEYEKALKLPIQIIKKPSEEPSRNNLENITEMIPLIPDPQYRQKFIEKYNCKNMNSTNYLSQFESINCNGERRCTIRVVPFLEQNQKLVEQKPPVRNADTRKLVSSVLK